MVSTPRRGEVWWASLRPPRGSEPGHPRPVLIIQSNRFNESGIQTVLVAAITSSLHLADAPGNVRIKAAESGLPKTSVVNVSQLVTVGRQFLTEKAATLPTAVMNQVGDGLRLVLGL